MEEIAKMATPFDFMFMDIDKEDYVAVLPHCARLLKPGACWLLTIIFSPLLEGAFGRWNIG